MIPMFFSIDDAYAPYLAAALCSAIDHASDDRCYKAIILHQELSQENISRLASLATENFSIEFVPMTQGLDAITDTMSNRLRCDYFTLTIYFRLFIPRMFPQYNKAIYIDSDVILLEDPAKLFDIPLQGNLIGACVDRSVGHVPQLVNYMENAVGVPKEKYINSGVLLMDLQKLRQAELDRHFLQLLNTYHFDCIAPDQDYLNYLCRGKVYYFDAGWNKQPNQNVDFDENKIHLIHYNMFNKPWHYYGVKYESYFWEAAKATPYYEELIASRESYTEKERECDLEGAKKLIAATVEIMRDKCSFCHVIGKDYFEKTRLD